MRLTIEFAICKLFMDIQMIILLPFLVSHISVMLTETAIVEMQVGNYLNINACIFVSI